MNLVAKLREAILYRRTPQTSVFFGRSFLALRLFALALLLPIPLLFGYRPLLALETIEEIRAGDEEFARGDYRKSLTHYISATKQNPNSTVAFIGYGNASLELRSYPDARLAFEKALSLSPNHPQAIAGIGLVTVREGNPQEAKVYLEKESKTHSRNPEILLALAETYEALGKPELALYKLDSILKETQIHPALLERKIHLLLEQKQYVSAQTEAQKYIQLFPNSPTGYRLLGRILSLVAYQSPNGSKTAEHAFRDAMQAFETALVLREEDEKTLYHRTKLKIWKDGESRTESITDLRQLIERQPENWEYRFIYATLSMEKSSLTQAELDQTELAFIQYLKSHDLDEISRFRMENFAIRFLAPESRFRKKLGAYRMERYKSEKNSLQFQSSLYHLWRAEELVATAPDTVQARMDAYREGTDLFRFVNLLSAIVQEDPANYKAQNQLEYAVSISKKSLEYREGLARPTKQGLIYKDLSSTPKIAILDFQPDVPMDYRIHLPRTIRQSVEMALFNLGGVRLASPSETIELEKIIRSSRQGSFNSYHQGYFFNASESPSYPTGIRYIGIGKTIDSRNSLQIEFTIYDRVSGKYSEPIRLRSVGRSNLANLSMSLAHKIKNYLPKEGKILKVKKEGVLVNLGTNHQLTKKSKIRFLRNGREIMNGEILELGTSLCLVRPHSLDWERDLATEDFVIADPN